MSEKLRNSVLAGVLASGSVLSGCEGEETCNVGGQEVEVGDLADYRSSTCLAACQELGEDCTADERISITPEGEPVLAMTVEGETVLGQQFYVSPSNIGETVDLNCMIRANMLAAASYFGTALERARAKMTWETYLATEDPGLAEFETHLRDNVYAYTSFGGDTDELGDEINEVSTSFFTWECTKFVPALNDDKESTVGINRDGEVQYVE